MLLKQHLPRPYCVSEVQHSKPQVHCKRVPTAVGVGGATPVSHGEEGQVVGQRCTWVWWQRGHMTCQAFGLDPIDDGKSWKNANICATSSKFCFNDSTLVVEGRATFSLIPVGVGEKKQGNQLKGRSHRLGKWWRSVLGQNVKNKKTNTQT